MDLIRYWKDPEYRGAARGKGTAPEHPAGSVELNEQAMSEVIGARTEPMGSLGCCPGYTAEHVCNTEGGPCAPTQRAYTCSGAACK